MTRAPGRWPDTFRFCGGTFQKRSVSQENQGVKSARRMFGIVRVDCSYSIHAAVTANGSKCKRPNSETLKHTHGKTKGGLWRSKNARPKLRVFLSPAQNSAEFLQLNFVIYDGIPRDSASPSSGENRAVKRRDARGGSAERKALRSWGMVMLSIDLVTVFGRHFVG